MRRYRTISPSLRAEPLHQVPLSLKEQVAYPLFRPARIVSTGVRDAAENPRQGECCRELWLRDAFGEIVSTVTGGTTQQRT